MQKYKPHITHKNFKSNYLFFLFTSNADENWQGADRYDTADAH